MVGQRPAKIQGERWLEQAAKKKGGWCHRRSPLWDAYVVLFPHSALVLPRDTVGVGWRQFGTSCRRQLGINIGVGISTKNASHSCRTLNYVISIKAPPNLSNTSRYKMGGADDYAHDRDPSGGRQREERRRTASRHITFTKPCWSYLDRRGVVIWLGSSKRILVSRRGTNHVQY